MMNLNQLHLHDQNQPPHFLLPWLLRISSFLQGAKAQTGSQPISAKCMPSAKLWGALAGHFEIRPSEPKFTTPCQAMLRKQAVAEGSCTVLPEQVTSGSVGRRWETLIWFAGWPMFTVFLKSEGLELYKYSILEVLLCFHLNNIPLLSYKKQLNISSPSLLTSFLFSLLSFSLSHSLPLQGKIINTTVFFFFWLP